MKIKNRIVQNLFKVMSERHLTVEEAMTSLLIGENYLSDNEISPMVDYLQMTAITTKMSKLVSHLRVKNSLMLVKPKVVIALNNKEHYYEVINAISVKYKNVELLTDVNIKGVDDYQSINRLKPNEADIIAVYDLSVFGDYQPAVNAVIDNIIRKRMILYIAKTDQVIRDEDDLSTIVSDHFKDLSEASE